MTNHTIDQLTTYNIWPLTWLNTLQWQEDIPWGSTLRACRKCWCLALSLKPWKPIAKGGMSRALTLTNWPSMTMTTTTLKMQVTLKGNRLSSRQESARPLWTCSWESFSSARERWKPSTTTKWSPDWTYFKTSPTTSSWSFPVPSGSQEGITGHQISELSMTCL